MYNLTNEKKQMRILVVDDEQLIRRSLSEQLTLSGHNVATAANGREALDVIKKHPVQVVITDLKMPEVSGMDLLRTLKKESPNTVVIVITGHATVDTAIDAIKEGAFDYLTKPINDNALNTVFEKLFHQKRLFEENLKLKKHTSGFNKETATFSNIVGQNPKMLKIYSLIEAICNTRSTVLIRGESGTGKHLVAQAIHACDESNKHKPFIEVSCGALTETLLESELFGHVKGAFTGAIKDKIGRFELAHGGTIFLDEIDAFTPNLQVKLLRVLQSGEFERVGDSTTVKIDLRVIAATNQDLQELIAQGKFRKDLYYRLNIIPINLPSLMERKDDIPLLVKNFIKKHSKKINKDTKSIDDKALSILVNYNWPGNIRELENIIERATILSTTPTIVVEDLPDFIRNTENVANNLVSDASFTLKDALKSPEKDIIIKTLDTVDWNRNEAAKALNINRTTLYKKMVKYGLLKKLNKYIPPQPQN